MITEGKLNVYTDVFGFCNRLEVLWEAEDEAALISLIPTLPHSTALLRYLY